MMLIFLKLKNIFISHIVVSQNLHNLIPCWLNLRVGGTISDNRNTDLAERYYQCRLEPSRKI